MYYIIISRLSRGRVPEEGGWRGLEGEGTVEARAGAVAIGACNLATTSYR